MLDTDKQFQFLYVQASIFQQILQCIHLPCFPLDGPPRDPRHPRDPQGNPSAMGSKGPPMGPLGSQGILGIQGTHKGPHETPWAPKGSKRSNWALVSEPGFLKFQIFRCSILEVFCFWTMFSKIMLVRYRGINNKGVLERPWTIWRVLEAISTTLKCQFTGKCRKVDFLPSCTTKSAENLHVAPYGRCGHPGNP